MKKSFTRFLNLLFVFCLMCLSTTLKAQTAQKTVQLYAEDVSACYSATNEYQVKISMMDFIELVKFNWVLQFESSVFDYKGSTLTGALPGITVTESLGNVTFTWDNGTTPVTLGENVKTDVAILKFSIKHFPSNLANSYLSPLLWTKNEFYNLANQKIDLTGTPPVNGKLNVTVGLTNVTAVVNPVSCAGLDANVTVTSPAEGTGYMYLFNEDPDPSKWVWSSIATSSAPANTTNVFRVKDSNGCISLQKEFKVTDVDPLTYTVHTQASLCNSGNGEILLTPIGGTAPYTYWVVPVADFNSVQTILSSTAGKTATALNKYKKTAPQILRPAGDYKVAVDDVNLCNDLTVLGYWKDASIIEPPKTSTITISEIVNETCSGAKDGSFKVTLTDGANGEFRLSVAGMNVETSGRTYTFTNMAPGTYFVTSMDANGCTISSENIVILGKTPITFTTDVTNTSCGSLNDGQIVVSNIQGGTAPYSVSITENGNTTTQTNVDAAGYTFTNLKPTYYSLTITDANSCLVNYSNPDNLSNVIAVQSPEDINISGIELVNPACSDDDATLKAIGVTGGIGVGYLYSMDEISWQPSNTFVVTQPFSPSYTIFVKNATGNSCMVSQATSLNEVVAPNLLTASVNNVTPPTCADGLDGNIKIDIAGGTTPYSYSVNEGEWIEIVNALEINNATVGDYSINIKDAHGCLIAAPLVFTITQDTNVITADADLIECAGDKTVINVNWTSWSNGGSSRTIMYKYSSAESNVFTSGVGFIPGTTLFAAGTYYVGAFDQFGCVSEPVAVIVKENAELNISSVVANGATCFGSTKGTITVQATGGTVDGLLQYALLNDESQYNNIDEASWLDFDTYDSATTLSTVSLQVDKGVYYIAVRDNHCAINRKNYGPITVTGYDPLLVKESLIVKTNILCAGSAAGSLNIPINTAVSGGAGAYLFTLLDASGNPINGRIKQPTGLFDNLPAGTYSILVEDIHGCPSYTTSTFTITEPSFLTFSTDNSYFSCNNSNDGLITINVNGGVGPYSYAINNKRNWISFIGGSKTYVTTETGIFNVWVKDANGCVRGPEIVEIKGPSKIVPTVNVLSTIACNGGNDGQIEVSATGGWEGLSIYNYKVDNGAWSDQTTISGLTGGAHTLYVKDAALYTSPYQSPNEDCVFSLPFTISEPEPIVYNISISDVKCKGGSDGTFTVSVLSGLNPYFTDDDNDTNDGYDITLTGDNYNQTVRSGVDNKVTFSGLPTGMYTVNISDANGCSIKATTGDNAAPFETSESWKVGEPVAELTVVPVLVNNVSCFGTEDGKFKITVTGGTAPYKYYAAYTILADGTVVTPEAPVAGSNEWKDTNEFVGPAGTSVVWVIDANGCTAGGLTDSLGQPVDTWKVTVTQSQQIAWTFASPSYLEPTAFGKENGKIYLSPVTGGNSQYTAIVTGNSAANVAKVYTQTVSASTGWTINNIAASDAKGYNVKIIDSNNCETEVQNIVVTQPELLTLTLAKGADAFTCPDVVEGLLEATANGGVAPYTYSLYKDGILHTGFVSPSSFLVQIGHTFKVIVKDAKGNTADASIDINRIQPVLAYATDVSCYGAVKPIVKIFATGEPGRTFVVQYAPVVDGVEGAKSLEIPFDGNVNIADLDYDVTYKFYVSDSEGCVGTPFISDFDRIQNPLDVAVVKSQDELSATLTITGGETPYSYQVGNGSILPSTDGTVSLSNLKMPETTVNVYDARGCMVSKTITVSPILVTASPASGNNMDKSFVVTLTFSRQVTIGAGDITGGTYTPGTGTSFAVTMTGNDLATLTLALGTGIKDAAGNVFDGKTFTYKVGDHVGPTVVVTPPSVPVSTSFKVTLKFNEPVQGIQNGGTSITATNGNITDITGSGDTYTITVAAAEQTNVSIILNNQIKDISPNANAFAGQTLNYKTGDFTAPALVTKYPTLNDVLVDNHPLFKMTFGEAVKLGAGGNFKVYKVGTTTAVLDLPITAAMINGKEVAVTYSFTAVTPLELNTTYYVKVDGSALTDLAGNKYIGISDAASWTFKTGSKWPNAVVPGISLEFKVYPNPFGDFVNIDNASQLSKVIVTNIAGQFVKQVVNPTDRIELKGMHSGIYYISLYDKDNEIIQTTKLVKR